MSVIEKFNNLSVEELENYGRDTQSVIDENTEELIKGFKCIDFGQYGKKVIELKTFANRSSNKLTAIAPVAKVNQLLGKYDNMENQLNQIEKVIVESKDKLNQAINISLNNNIKLRDMVKKFDSQIEELKEYISYLQDLQEKGELEDDLKLQIAANRLKVLTTFKVSAEHVQIQTLIQIKMYKETASQMEDAVVDVFPQFKLQLINILGIKLHKDSVDILDGVYKLANDSFIETSKQIADMAVMTQKNRHREILTPETIRKANAIMQPALEQVANDASNTTEANLEIVKQLMETSEQMRVLLKQNNG